MRRKGSQPVSHVRACAVSSAAARAHEIPEVPLPGAIFKVAGSFSVDKCGAWFVVSGDALADEIRVVRSVLGAISCHQLPSQRELGRNGGFKQPYRGTSLIRSSAPLGPYSRTMPRALWWSWFSKALGFRVQGSGFSQCSVCRVQGSGCRVQGSGCSVQGPGCRVSGPASSGAHRRGL